MIPKKLQDYTVVSQPSDGKMRTGSLDPKFSTNPLESMANQGDKDNIVYGAVANRNIDYKGPKDTVTVKHGSPVHIKGIGYTSSSGPLESKPWQDGLPESAHKDNPAQKRIEEQVSKKAGPTPMTHTSGFFTTTRGKVGISPRDSRNANRAAKGKRPR